MEVCDRAFSVMEAPFQRDTVRELCDAARISTDHSPIRPTLGVQGDGVMTIGNRFVTITYKPGKRTGCPSAAFGRNQKDVRMCGRGS